MDRPSVPCTETENVCPRSSEKRQIKAQQAVRLGVDSSVAPPGRPPATLSNPTLLALASDEELSELLSALRPLLRCCDSTGRWVVPAVADALQPLQNTCQERLSRVSQPCSVQLATAAAGFFAGVMREGGNGAVVQDGLLAAVAEYVLSGCSALEGSALASLLALLLEARFQPAHPITFGNAVIKRVLQLSHAPPGMRLRHLADSVEALAQLSCCDAASAPPVISVAVGVALAVEAQHCELDSEHLLQLARVMQGVAVIAVTTPVCSSIVLAASAAWHLQVMRVSAAAQQQAGLGTAISHMWCTSRLLAAAGQANAHDPHHSLLTGCLGLMGKAASADREARGVPGPTSAQRRVLSALCLLGVPAPLITVNCEFKELFQISIAVRMSLQTGEGHRQVAILVRDPLKHLLRGSSVGAPLGAQLAQERMLQAAGWTVCPLVSQSCLQLPLDVLAAELAALMLGERERSSLRFVA
ncbi:hypothetical protein D9Q98_003182 [Chlorella vulgaris]|uniref:Uncharacterized protein n=1 Tax=Chlorella vulgaris TaxID=3077 RepID=A0A9D4TSI6_CHLVU|nr:hypothetical protein D9Q98_003182 [Chlorella vulgaris]